CLLIVGYLRGWRISDILSLRREDLDLEQGLMLTRWEDNKGDADSRVKLHPIVPEHLRKLASFEAKVFPWPHRTDVLYVDFARIQRAAGIHLPCRKEHEHRLSCHLYGFDDLRRAFATMNASRLSTNALQALMRHKSYATTLRYIELTRQMDEA